MGDQVGQPGIPDGRGEITGCPGDGGQHEDEMNMSFFRRQREQEGRKGQRNQDQPANDLEQNEPGLATRDHMGIQQGADELEAQHDHGNTADQAELQFGKPEPVEEFRGHGGRNAGVENIPDPPAQDDQAQTGFKLARVAIRFHGTSVKARESRLVREKSQAKGDPRVIISATRALNPLPLSDILVVAKAVKRFCRGAEG